MGISDLGRGRLGQLTSASSRFLNKRGIYLGKRSARIHVAVYRRSGGRLSGHIPGWPDARIALLDHVGAKTGDERSRLWSSSWRSTRAPSSTSATPPTGRSR